MEVLARQRRIVDVEIDDQVFRNVGGTRFLHREHIVPSFPEPFCGKPFWSWL